MKKIAILILSTKHPSFEPLIDACFSTWVSEFESNGVDVFFNVGDNTFSEIQIDANVITSPSSDDFSGTLQKTYHALTWLFTNYDIVYRTNLSSYLDFTKFFDFIETNSINNDSYIGIHGSKPFFREYVYSKIGYYLPFTDFGKKIDFASGSGFFIGKNVFNSISSNCIYSNLIDDFGLSYFGASKFLSDIQPSRYWFGVSSSFDPSTYHFRFKSQNRNLDASFMIQFHKNKSFYIKNYF